MTIATGDTAVPLGLLIRATQAYAESLSTRPDAEMAVDVGDLSDDIRDAIAAALEAVAEDLREQGAERVRQASAAAIRRYQQNSYGASDIPWSDPDGPTERSITAKNISGVVSTGDGATVTQHMRPGAAGGSGG